LAAAINLGCFEKRGAGKKSGPFLLGVLRFLSSRKKAKNFLVRNNSLNQKESRYIEKRSNERRQKSWPMNMGFSTQMLSMSKKAKS
jgi:hypothetical protein